jgi:hypothetical protein
MAMLAVNWKPDRSHLRGFGTVCVIMLAAIGAWIYWQQKLFWFAMSSETARQTALWLWGAAFVCLVLRFAAPGALKPLYFALTAVTLPIGFVLSHVIMAVIFYGVLTPFGLFFRLIGRDPLHRRFDPSAATYWVKREPVRDVKRYFRQF